MPTIFNVGNSYNINNKKISSKITFESGERFSGRIIKKDGTNEVTIRLRDGWEFSAEIEGEISDFKGFQRFEVEGFEGEKLKLKLLSKNIGNTSDRNNELSNLLLKNGLSEEDIDLLKDMINFNIPLNKEKIKEIKGLINFLNKLNINDNVSEEFISKFLSSKNIDGNSTEGQIIKNLLKDFFYDYKSLTKEDVLLFYENNIEFNSENINSYKNIFNDENKLFKNINNLKDIIINENLDEGLVSKSLSVEILNKEDTSILLPKNLEGNNLNVEYENKYNEKNIESKFVSNSYQKLDGNSKINLLSILKSLSGYEEDYLNTTLKDVLLNNKEKFSSRELEKAFSVVENINSEDFIKDIKSKLEKSVNLNSESRLNYDKKDIENLLSKKIGKSIELSNKEFIKIKDIINLNKDDIELKINTNNKSQEQGIIEDSFNDIIKIKSNSTEEIKLSEEIINEAAIDNLNKEVKESIKNIGNNKKEVLKEVIRILEGLKEEVLPEKVVNFLKNNINEIKLFNKLSLEYYYADIPVNINERDYPCKIIIKDKRKDNKKIDASNVKMIVTIDTSNLGIIDGYIKVLGKKINIELKCEDKYIKVIEESKHLLNSNIERLGFLVDIKVDKKENDVSLANCREFFNEEFGLSLDKRV